MANHMWVCPTKKQDEFYNPETLISLLKKEFPQYKNSFNQHFIFIQAKFLKNF